MPPKIYNTLNQRKEVLEPLVPGHVRMYACGPTVYDLAHIGHARAALTFDVIWRYLEYRGYKVIYVRNYTDVDDKIINRAGELGQSCESLAEAQIEAYRQDMRVLGLRMPTEEPRATRHIREMVAIIQRLIERGFAYCVDSDVYFEVRRFPDYGKLSHRDLQDLRAGARVEVDPRKRDPLDFALWKASKPGEPAWESPWGPGRPGWHIECSAMSMKYLGETFDIHGGGADLIFPHHENEIAQSECATGKPFARYWVHNGFVNIHAEKMSKSLGNVLTVRELLDRVTPDSLKIFLLGTHYRAPLDFSEEGLFRAGSAEDRFWTTLAEIQRLDDVPSTAEIPSRIDPSALLRQIAEAEQEFTEAMDDDFNTPRALAAMFNLTREMNVALREAADSPGKGILDALSLAGDALRRLGSVLGGLFEGPAARQYTYVGSGGLRIEGSGDVSFSPLSNIQIRMSDYVEAREAIEMAISSGQLLPEGAVNTVLEYRRQCREARDWAAADRIRAWLADIGVIVDDTAQGARWRVKAGGA